MCLNPFFYLLCEGSNISSTENIEARFVRNVKKIIGVARTALLLLTRRGVAMLDEAQ